MTETPRLGLPLLAAAQAQKHVTHNEALLLLDMLAQLAVLDRDLGAPPASPGEGERWIVGPAPTGAWAGRAGQVAMRLDGAWVFRAPKPGWLAYVLDEEAIVIWTGSAWAAATAPTSLQNLTRLGLGTAADAANPFAAKLNKALWTARTLAEGGDGDLRYTLNKEAAARTLSLLLQSGFSGRAEIGLVGDDDLALKVSADGAAWIEALRVDRTTGALRLRAGTAALPSLTPGGDPDTGIWCPGADTIAWSTGGIERMRVTASGQVGIGVAPAERLHVNGAILLDLASPPAWDTNTRFWAGAGFGARYDSFQHRFDVGGSRVEALRIDSAAQIRPGSDATQALGTASFRWSQLFAATGTIGTSDGTLKQRRGDLSPQEIAAWGAVRPQIYRWLDAVAEKGEDGARLHAGFVAQDVAAAFAAAGLDVARYALFCRDRVTRTAARVETRLVPRVIEREESVAEIEIRDGVPVRVERVRLSREPMVEMRPVLDEAGGPVLREGAPVLHPVPVLVEESVETEVEEPAGWRLGLRYDQCLVVEAAWQRARIAALEARVAALEAAG